MRRYWLFLLLAIAAACGHATAAAPDGTAIVAVITAQISALRRGEAARAFSYASPGIQARFGDPSRFMAMVREGYAPLTQPGSLHFGALDEEKSGEEQSGPVQHLDLIDGSGTITQADYFMEREPDGSWRIAGCALLKPPQTGA